MLAASQHFAVTGNFTLKISKPSERSAGEGAALMRRKSSHALISVANNGLRSVANNVLETSAGCAMDGWDHETQMLAYKVCVCRSQLKF